MMIGTNVYDQAYLVGRVIEVNYKTSRVLLLSDLNSNIPVTIAPQNIQAIVTGASDNYGQIKYIKSGLTDELTEDSIVYTSGTGAIFKSGIPIGKLRSSKDDLSTEYNVEFYSDFSQLKYVFAEIITKTEVSQISEDENKQNNPYEEKLRILEDEVKIIEETNIKFKDENENLKNEVNDLSNKVLSLKNEISSQKQIINQFDIDKKEMEFLKLNLDHGHKCRKSFFNNKGFVVGSEDYRSCVFNKGRPN